MWGAMFLAGEDPEKIGRHRWHQLLSCVMPGMDVSWDEGAVDLPAGAKVWLFGTTDRFRKPSRTSAGWWTRTGSWTCCRTL